MGFFRKLFGAKSQPPTAASDPAFEADFNESLQRYLSMPGSSFEHEFKDDSGRVLTITEAFRDTYQQWKGIQSPWDKSSLLYQAFDDSYGKRLKLWQAMERFITDRYPDRALAIAGKHAKEEDFRDADFLSSLTRCHQMLAEYGEGTGFAEQAIGIDPQSKRARVALADLYHLEGRHEEAHTIYQEILEQSSLKELPETTIGLHHIVSFRNDILPSSVYAVGLLQSAGADDAAWDQIAAEFYHCPYFRCQHAFYLIGRQENLRGLAKLVSLSQEFPWYREGVVNAHQVILQFRQQMNQDDFMAEEEKYLKEVMEKAVWN